MSDQTKPRETIFVVDDEPVVADTLAAILRQVGFATNSFHHPQAALDQAQINCPNLLITDVIMPGMTGIDLAIQMQKVCPQCKVLLFSGQAATADLLEEARTRGHEFELLSKPIHPADLLAKISNQE
ncbi:response regulator [Acidicapsa dinghuensis]|uniref:Response regulator n=1 Tax=Acidicapsa dinghuensis TaxID=2218256 RepID=A0ABW1EIN4_9BACT|nr:response regulator [Acidicapsa dinghuensis]